MKRLNLIQIIASILVLISLYYLSQHYRSNIGDSDQILGACSLEQLDCAIDLQGETLWVRVKNRPVLIEEEIQFEFVVPQHIKINSAHIEGVNMFMGIIPLIFNKSDKNKAVSFLGSCTEPKMQWRLVLQLEDAKQETITKQLFFNTDTSMG